MKILLFLFIISLVLASLFLNYQMSNLAKKVGGKHKFGLFGGLVEIKIKLSYDCEKIIKNEGLGYIGKGLDFESCEIEGNKSIITYKNNSKNTTTIDKIPPIPMWMTNFTK